MIMSLKPIFLSILMLCALSNSSVVISMERKSLLFNQPYFTLSVKYKGLYIHARVNGVEVYSEFSERPVEVEVPVNHWMAPDKNELEILLKPLLDGVELSPHSYLEMSLLVRQSEALGEKPFKVADIVFDGELLHKLGKEKSLEKSMPVQRLDSTRGFTTTETGDVILRSIRIEKYDEENHFYRAIREIEVPSEIPRWAFLDSDIIPDIEEESMSEEVFERFLDSLIIEYRKVHNALKNNDIEPIMPMFEERNRETDAAFYFEPGTLAKKMKSALQEAAVDEDAELEELNADHLMFDISENKKLARLIGGDDSKAIVQNFKSGMGSQSFDLVFRYKDGKWILTR